MLIFPKVVVENAVVPIDFILLSVKSSISQYPASAEFPIISTLLGKLVIFIVSIPYREYL